MYDHKDNIQWLNVEEPDNLKRFQEYPVPYEPVMGTGKNVLQDSGCQSTLKLRVPEKYAVIMRKT